MTSTVDRSTTGRGRILTRSNAHARAAMVFAQRVRTFSEALRERRRALEDTHPRILTHDIQALLDEQREELDVAEEELRTQIDELESAARSIDAERRRFRDLFHAQLDALVVTDRKGTIYDANERGCAIFAIDLKFAQRKPFVTWVDESAVRRVRELIGAPLVDVPFELRFKRRTGERFDARVQCTQLDGGELLAWAIRPLVADAPRNDAQLERMLRDKDDLLARERARCTELEREIRIRDRLFGVVAHDLRGPVHAILSWARTMKSEHLDTPARVAGIDAIERSARTQLAMLDELVDVGRIVDGTVRTSVAAVDFPVLVRRVADAAGRAAADLGVALTTTIAESCHGMILGDASRVEQIVSTMLAIAMARATRGSTVALDLDEDQTDYILQVATDGDGPDGPALGSLVAPRGAETEGSIRLMVARQLAEVHGGTIDVASEDARATFTLRLPARPFTSTAPAPSTHMLLDGMLEGTRVLVVEDDAHNLELFEEILGHHGAVVGTATNAEGALALFAPFRPDVVLCEVELPGEDGCGLLRRLRAVDDRVAAIALGAFGRESELARTLEAGFDLHLTKPLDPTKLVEAVAELARGRDDDP